VTFGKRWPVFLCELIDPIKGSKPLTILFPVEYMTVNADEKEAVDDGFAVVVFVAAVYSYADVTGLTIDYDLLDTLTDQYSGKAIDRVSRKYSA
jgi:hypothetical protein